MTQGFELKFGSDTKLRKQVFTAASFAHPAKMHLSLQMYLIEHYTKAGETILDPMGGSGTLLMATTIGRNVVIVELEQKFVDMAKANWQKIQRLGPMLGYTMGTVVILQGDARDLQGLLADKVVFSPPYAEHGDTRMYGGIKDPVPLHAPHGLPRKFGGKNNIGNLPYGKIDTVISSPPYNAEPTVSESYKRIRSKIGRDITKPSQQYAKYSAKADCICTSPPYEGSEVGKGIRPNRWGKVKNNKGFKGRKEWQTGTPSHYSDAQENIGNMKSDNYLTEMLKVYRQCHSALKDKGLMCIVVKNFIRDKKIVQLDLDTIKLCETAGFALKERLARKLTQQSFWRRIYEQRYPDAPKIEFEDILIFEKLETQ